MSARLRAWLEHPIGADQRGRAFALAAGAVLLGLLALSFTRPNEHPASPHPTTAAPLSVSQGSPPLSPARPAHSVAAARPWRLEAERAARGFLAGYLRFLYGHAGAIRDAAPALMRRLAHERVRVSPAQRRRDPRVIALRADLRRVGAAAVVSAWVADGGVARYSIELILRRHARRWLVAAVVSE